MCRFSCLEGWSDTEDTHWDFYTDGGADPPEITNGKVTTPSRAGWGVVVWRPDHVHEFFGPVVRVSSLQLLVPCNLPYFIDPRFQECTFIMIPRMQLK